MRVSMVRSLGPRAVHQGFNAVEESAAREKGCLIGALTGSALMIFTTSVLGETREDPAWAIESLMNLM